jgi:uncharacterized protein (TIGR00661 family)
MRVLYGVQGTGNGHITRARTMARALANSSLEVEYLFSGRSSEDYFNMEPFGEFRCYRGLTFGWANGQISYLKTIFNNNLIRFVHDVKQLDLSAYDLVITDFEPITAWAARLQNRPSLGIGHQYAFHSPEVPTAGHSFIGEMLLRHFAPAQRTLGFHWHHFNSAILPPLIEPLEYPLDCDPDRILVYLPFERIQRVTDFLRPFNQVEFYIYCACSEPRDEGHLHLRPFNRAAFQQDLAVCNGVVTNAGFGLLSEAIQAGKKLLVKPMQRQMEQLSNAAAIDELEIGEVMHEFNSQQLSEWLHEECPGPRPYPDVAEAIVEWIESGFKTDERQMAQQLWRNCLQFQFPAEDESEAVCSRAR